jgi:hypothetical protein
VWQTPHENAERWRGEAKRKEKGTKRYIQEVNIGGAFCTMDTVAALASSSSLTLPLTQTHPFAH